MSEFVSYDGLKDSSEPIRCARLVGDGWYIEVQPIDDRTFSIRCHGTVSGADELLVLSGCANNIKVLCNVEYNRHVHEEAVAIHETWKANEEFRKRKGIKETTP